jgi:glycosyltransferase involved in cell wall biosynthesis
VTSGRLATDRRLAFLACPADGAHAALVRLAAIRPGAAWDVVCFQPPPAPLPPGMRAIVSRHGGLPFAARLWLRAAVRRYRAVYIAYGCHVRPAALAPLIAFVALLPTRERRLVDMDGAVQHLDVARVRDVVCAAVIPALLSLARTVTWLGLKVVSPAAAHEPRGHRVALLVPVLPDLSHTFVYREVLALAERHPEWDVIALEQGAAPVVHRDAAALQRLAHEVPRPDPVRYLVDYLRHWAKRPRAMASVIEHLAPHTATFGPGAPAGDDALFLRLEWLGHTNHPISGLRLASFLERRGIGAVHVWGATYPAVRAVVAHRLLGVRMSVSTFVDFDYPTPFHMLREKLEASVFCVACTGYCAARLTERFPDLGARVRVLRHAVPLGLADGKALRAPDGRSRVVFIGRFVPKKGLDTLLHACALLRDGGLDVNCHLWGGGDEEPRLRALAGRLDLGTRVVFEGPIANEHVYSVMNRDDVFVCPSRIMPDGERDGIPVALLETMAAGIPIVSTTVSGIPELVEDGINGYLVRPDDAEALAACLARLLSDPSARRRISDAAQRTVRRDFALEVAIERLDGWISRETMCGP